MVSRQTHREAKDAVLHVGLEQDGADGVGRTDSDQERGRPHLDISSQLQGGNLW